MFLCPICGWPLHTANEMKTHIEIKHNEVKFLTIKPFGNQFKMQIHHNYPKGKWDLLGGFWRKHDDQHFIALGQGVYAGEVDADKLSADVSEFLGLGRQVNL